MPKNLNMSWEDAFSSAEAGNVAASVKALPVPDALVRSIRDRARVDMGYLCELTGLPEADVVSALGDSIFFDPEALEWKTADDYLSGNLRRKLKAAEEASGHPSSHAGTDNSEPLFARNIAALREAIPPCITAN